MRRRRLYLLAALIVVLLACYLCFQSQTLESITPATLSRIENGMTLSEVNEILGGPPTGGRTVADIGIWEGSEGTAFVWFDNSGHVYASQFGNVVAPRWKRILRKLGLM
jgi:hypothetical protein